MPHISHIFVGCFGLVVWAIGVPIAAAAVNLDALFWEKRSEVTDLPYAVIASFVDHSNSSFLIKSHKDAQLVFITPTDDVQIDGIMYQFDRFLPEGVFLVGPDAQSVRIAMRFGDDAAKQTSAPEITADAAQVKARQTAWQSAPIALGVQPKIRPRVKIDQTDKSAHQSAHHRWG